MLMMKMSEKYATANRRSPNLGGREGGRQKLTQSSLLRRFLAPWDTISGQKEVIREIQKWRIQKVEPATDEFPCENAATEHSAAASAARRMRSSTIFLKRRETWVSKEISYQILLREGSRLDIGTWEFDMHQDGTQVQNEVFIFTTSRFGPWFSLGSGGAEIGTPRISCI